MNVWVAVGICLMNVWIVYRLLFISDNMPNKPKTHSDFQREICGVCTLKYDKKNII